MAATINTNIASINAQRNLALSGQSLNITMQRLSSGLRVNSAKDDAAGLAIAERMNTQVKGLTMASRNANDGISLAQTAEGALGKVGDMLQRMRELAVQASNATNSASDRAALQAEVKQLAAEVDRVAKQTNFNGQKILDGSFAGAVFQVGANSGDNVTLGALADTRSSQISTVNYGVSKLASISTDDTTDPTKPAIADFAKTIPAGALTIDVGNGAFKVPLEELKPVNSSLERLGQVITAINNRTADSGVTAFMTKNPGTQTYDISFMSERTDGDGIPMNVNFQGFTSSTTGIGYATAEYVQPFQHEIDAQVTTARAAGGPLVATSTAVGEAKVAANAIAAQMKSSSLATSNEKLQQAIATYEQAIAGTNTDTLLKVNGALDELVTAYKTAHATTPQPITPMADQVDKAMSNATHTGGALSSTATLPEAQAFATTISNAIKNAMGTSTGHTLSAEITAYNGAIAALPGTATPSDVKSTLDTLVSAYQNAYANITASGNPPVAAINNAITTARSTGLLATGTPVADARTEANTLVDNILSAPIKNSNPTLANAIGTYTAAVGTSGTPGTATDLAGINGALDALINAYSTSLPASTPPLPATQNSAISDAIIPTGALSASATEVTAARTAANSIAADIKASSLAASNPELAEAISTYEQEIADETTNNTADSVKEALERLTTAYKGILDQTPVPSPMDMNDADEFMTNQRGIDNIDVTTQAGAWVALKKIDSAIDQINGARATLGAMQARFETAVNNINVQVENLSAARGRIMDADFAVETANLSRTQILQQAGTAMVAQANQIPQNVLQLLQG